jgi:hypothetical protein
MRRRGIPWSLVLVMAVAGNILLVGWWLRGGESCADGTCIGRDDVIDCATTAACREYGQCTLVQERCAVGGKDCPGTCPDAGECTVVRHRCAAGTDADCRGSLMCRERGQCVYRDGACWPTDAICRTLPVCTERGHCSAHGSFCAAVRDADCKGSRYCIERGRCAAAALICVANPGGRR